MSIQVQTLLLVSSYSEEIPPLSTPQLFLASTLSRVMSPTTTVSSANFMKWLLGDTKIIAWVSFEQLKAKRNPVYDKLLHLLNV